jgi:hypothetical protein
MNAHDSFDWSNAGVGVIGLLLTVGAIVQATGAKRAALAASLAVYRRNAKDDVERLHRLASELLTAIEASQFELALHKAHDFVVECPGVREHHRGRLGREGGRLDLSYDLIAKVSRLLTSPKDRLNLVPDVQRVVRDMSGLAGILNREIDEEVR